MSMKSEYFLRLSCSLEIDGKAVKAVCGVTDIPYDHIPQVVDNLCHAAFTSLAHYAHALPGTDIRSTDTCQT